MMNLHKVLISVIILFFYQLEWKLTVGASIRDESLPCVNDKGCKRSIDEAEESTREDLLTHTYSSKKKNGTLQAQHLTYKSRAMLASFRNGYSEKLLRNKTTYLAYIKANSDSESNHIPLCKLNNEEDYLYDCSKIKSVKFACIGAKGSKIAECENFEEMEHPFPVCKEGSSNRVITCGGNSSDFWCFPSNGKKSPILPCVNEERHICLFGSGILEYCQNLKTVSEDKGIKNSLKESSQGKNSREGKESALKENQEIKNLCLGGSNKLLPCSEDPLSFPACINPIDGKIELCEELENILEIGVSICIQGSTSRLLTCEKYSQNNLCYSPTKKKSSIKPCSALSKMICLSKDGLLTICSSSLTADNDSVQENNKFKGTVRSIYIMNGSEMRKSQVANMMKKWHLDVSGKYDNLKYLCTGGKEEKEIIYCERNATTHACFGAESGTITECNTLRETEIAIPVCSADSTYALVTCGKFNSVNLCVSDSSMAIFRTCKRNARSACFKKGSIQYCSEKRLTSRSSDLIFSKVHRFPRVSSTQNREVFYKDLSSLQGTVTKYSREVCVLNETKGQYQKCVNASTPVEACYGLQESAIKACAAFGTFELISPVCVHPEKDRLLLVCEYTAEIPICYPEKGKKIIPCTGTERYVCLASDGTIERCPKNISDPKVTFLTKKEETWNESGKNDNRKVRNEEGAEGGNANYLSSRTEIENSARIDESYWSLCKPEKESDILINCDNDMERKFACVDTQEGIIDWCKSIDSDNEPYFICSEPKPPHIILTCDFASNEALCITRIDGEQFISPCDDKEKYACLETDGRIIKCNDVGFWHLAAEDFDEKFIRLQCANCSIANTFRVIGEHPDVLPEFDRFVFTN